MTKRLADAPDVMTVQEALEYLPVGKNWFYERLRDGSIPSRRVRRKIFISREVLQQFLTSAGQG